MRCLHNLSATSLVLLTTLLQACGGGESTNDSFITTETSSGSLVTQINASDKESWVYVDLDNTEEFLTSKSEPVWDLAFKRQLISLNNDELVAIAILQETSFDSVDGSPTADKFFNDASDDEDDLAFSQERGWYSYNLLKHELSARQPRTYIVRSTEGTLFKLSFKDYYDDNGNGGYPKFEWARVDGKKIITGGNSTPCSDEEQLQTALDSMGDFDQISSGTLMLDTDDSTGIVTVTLDASLGGPEQAAQSSYLYIDLEQGTILDLSDKEAREDDSWHVAFKRSELRSNSADSGPGQVQVSKIEQDLTSLQDVPSDPSWQQDDFVDEFCNVKTFGLDFIETAFGQWYEYDFENHAVRIKDDQTYIIQDPARNLVWGFAIDAFDDGVYTLRWKALHEQD